MLIINLNFDWSTLASSLVVKTKLLYNESIKTLFLFVELETEYFLKSLMPQLYFKLSSNEIALILGNSHWAFFRNLTHEHWALNIPLMTLQQALDSASVCFADFLRLDKKFSIWPSTLLPITANTHGSYFPFSFTVVARPFMHAFCVL